MKGPAPPKAVVGARSKSASIASKPSATPKKASDARVTAALASSSRASPGDTHKPKANNMEVDDDCKLVNLVPEGTPKQMCMECDWFGISFADKMCPKCQTESVVFIGDDLYDAKQKRFKEVNAIASASSNPIVCNRSGDITDVVAFDKHGAARAKRARDKSKAALNRAGVEVSPGKFTRVAINMADNDAVKPSGFSSMAIAANELLSNRRLMLELNQQDGADDVADAIPSNPLVTIDEDTIEAASESAVIEAVCKITAECEECRQGLDAAEQAAQASQGEQAKAEVEHVLSSQEDHPGDTAAPVTPEIRPGGLECELFGTPSSQASTLIMPGPLPGRANTDDIENRDPNMPELISEDQARRENAAEDRAAHLGEVPPPPAPYGFYYGRKETPKKVEKLDKNLQEKKMQHHPQHKERKRPTKKARTNNHATSIKDSIPHAKYLGNGFNAWMPKTVCCQGDSFSWADDYFNTLRDVHGPGILEHAELCYRESDYSTAFTGVNSFGTAAMMSRHRLNELLGYPEQDPEQTIPDIPHRWSVEWDPACNKELADHPSAPECRFENISWFCGGYYVTVTF